MNLKKGVLEPSPHAKAANLQRQHAALKEVFRQFAEHVKARRMDPQYFESLAVDDSCVEQQLLKLTVFGGKELRLCFDVIRDGIQSKGQVVCFAVPVHQHAQPDLRVQPTEVARWTFEENGETSLRVPETPDPLKMTEANVAVGIVGALILAAFAPEKS